LGAFLRRSQAEGAKLVLVITGKGAAASAHGPGLSDERGVLRRMVPHWLRMADLRGVVMGFEEASLRHGGGGALYVRLRRHRDGADRGAGP
jgi:DNA-nicking Smr family endonuclease